MRRASESPIPQPPIPWWRSRARRCGARSSRGMPGPSSATRTRTPSSGGAFGRDVIVPPRPASASRAFFDQRLERPLEQHRVALDDERLPGRGDSRSRPCARASARAPGSSARPARRARRRPPDLRRGGRPMRSKRCATRSSRSRSPRMCSNARAAVGSRRRLARRAARSSRRGSRAACRAGARTRAPCRPTPARARRGRACGGRTRPRGTRTRQQRLQRRNDAQPLHERRVAEVDRADAGLDDRRILRSSSRDVLGDARIVRGRGRTAD